MAAQPTAGIWDDDPDGASIVLATGRQRHDLLVIAEPALLTELDAAWGRPASRVRLSFLPGVSAPGGVGQEDSLYSYDRDGLGVLVARGRTSLFEGKPARRTTALARIAPGAGVRAALLVTRAASLGGCVPGDLLAIGDHLNLTGAPLFPATGLLDAAWDEPLTEGVRGLDGVRDPGVAALVPGPVRPSRTEARLLAALGADVVVTDTVAEAMALASRGVRVVGLAYVDAVADAAGSGTSSERRSAGRRAAAPPTVDFTQAPAPEVVLAAVEKVLNTLR
ncbi:purine-nucleoside phosphorylase [Actinomyces sp. MRS3W]|uniref:phosphorylase family protein n=1 Tax=Actinomyces sp. MRS3W TaxID=2800796 RepID=UPI0028FD6E51|nr:purine-nucleoside phosphorylase [Actinomyces sp. MRS3W]MDU0348908.1 purine-nucleoside phosphorylase [Actinomyces sp. MRS3W]